MAEDDELQLSDSACRVFVALALAGGHVSSASALQRMAGVSKRQTRARAVKELEREGLVVVDQVPGGAYTGFRLSPAVISDLIGWSESKTSVVSDVSKKTDLLTT